ncbi:MAG: GAF domain-containing sensor histidine kinase [Eubacteriales bacterium]
MLYTIPRPVLFGRKPRKAWKPLTAAVFIYCGNNLFYSFSFCLCRYLIVKISRPPGDLTIMPDALKKSALTFLRRAGYGLAEAQTYAFLSCLLIKDNKISKCKRKSLKRMGKDLKKGEKGSNTLVLAHKHEKWLTVVLTCVRILLAETKSFCKTAKGGALVETGKTLPGKTPQETKPKLLIICRVSPSAVTPKQLETNLRQILKRFIKSFDFYWAAFILLSQDKLPVCLDVSKDSHKKDHIWAARWQDLSKHLFFPNSPFNQKEWLKLFSPAAKTTLPVMLQVEEPGGTMEIVIFDTDAETAQRLLVKTMSLGRHMADMIQEFVFRSSQKRTRSSQKRTLRKLTTWLEMASTVSSSLDIGQALHVVAQLTADLFSARTSLYLLDENENLTPVVAVGSYDPKLRNQFKALSGQKPYPAITQAIQTQHPVIITPDNIYNLLPADIIEIFNYHWLIVVPILNKDKAIGIMQVDRPRDSRLKGFENEAAEIIFAIARVTAIAIENARLIEKLEQKELLLHKLVNKIITAQEDERKHLASELHDSVIQVLIAIWYRLQRIAPTYNSHPADCYGEIANLTTILGDQIRDIRRILSGLRPMILDNYGLIPAIKSYTNEIQEKHNITVGLHFDLNTPDSHDEHSGESMGRLVTNPDDNLRLPPQTEIALFRILQEALTNIIKHATATSIDVELQVRQKDILLTVRDNGTGFNQSSLVNSKNYNHLGLAGMQERALLLGGNCIIGSQPGKGTWISVKVPYTMDVEGRLSN